MPYDLLLVLRDRGTTRDGCLDRGARALGSIFNLLNFGALILLNNVMLQLPFLQCDFFVAVLIIRRWNTLNTFLLPNNLFSVISYGMYYNFFFSIPFS